MPQSFITADFPSIATHLQELFNASIKQSFFSSEWKKSFVIALNKVKTRSSPSNFRPISLLNCLSKILEHIVTNKSTLTLTHIIFSTVCRQALRKTIVSRQLLSNSQMISELGSTENMSLFCFSLISPRHSTLCHLLLLRKLENCGVSKSALRWIASYLSGRQQAVKGKDGTTSSYRPLNTGVPQGSVLGPLLFCLYIMT